MSRGGKEWDNRTFATLKLLNVALFVIESARLPKAKDNADPLEGQAPHGRLMTEASLPLEPVVGVRPATEAAGLVGEFVKGLAEEPRTGEPSPHDLRLAAGLSDRRNAAVLLHFAG